MEFLDLPNEMKEHIFFFVQVPSYAFCCRDFFSIFQSIKEREEAKSFRQLVEEKSIFACLPKFADDFWRCHNTYFCGDKGFGLPVKVHMNANKQHKEFGSALSFLARFPKMREYVPEEGLGTFLFRLGSENRDPTQVCPEYVAGYVHESLIISDWRETRKRLGRVSDLGLPDSQKEETIKLISYVAERLGIYTAYIKPFHEEWINKDFREIVSVLEKDALEEKYDWLKNIC